MTSKNFNRVLTVVVNKLNKCYFNFTKPENMKSVTIEKSVFLVEHEVGLEIDDCDKFLYITVDGTRMYEIDLDNEVKNSNELFNRVQYLLALAYGDVYNGNFDELVETEEVEEETTTHPTIETNPHVDVDCSNLKKAPKNSIYGMFGESQDTEHDRIKYLMDTHSLSPRVTINDDCMKTVLNMEELLTQRFGNRIAHKCKMYNNGYYGCPADRQGNRCCGKKWCTETWKRYEAIINPEWHHVSLATLANIDFDMLDKKRQVYLKAHRELKRTLADLSKCKTGHTYEARARKFMRDMISQYYDNEISYSMRKYLDLQLSMSNVVNGVWSSYVEPATGLHESRRYSRPTLTY